MGFRVGTGEEEVDMVVLVTITMVSVGYHRQCFHRNQKQACIRTFTSRLSTSCIHVPFHKHKYRHCWDLHVQYYLLTKWARQVLEQHNSFTSCISKFQRVTMNLSSAIRKWTDSLLSSWCDPHVITSITLVGLAGRQVWLTYRQKTNIFMYTNLCYIPTVIGWYVHTQPQTDVPHR